MTRVPDNWLPTRTSILQDMREGGQTGWERFLEAYGKLLYSVAVKAGLNDAEAKDAVQETLIALANGVQNYDHARGHLTKVDIAYRKLYVIFLFMKLN